jgi:hypothetical protein
MTTRVSEVIHQWMSWCPKGQARIQKVAARSDDEAVFPSASGSFKAHAMNWLGLFRNQTVLLALYFSVVGVLLSVFMGGINASMFFTGIVAGSLLSMLQGVRFWKTMNEVRENGAVFLVTLYDKTTITIILIVGMVPMLISLGVIPGVNMPMLNSITGELIFILFWWVLLVTWLWESQTKRHLLSDGLMLSLARES